MHWMAFGAKARIPSAAYYAGVPKMKFNNFKMVSVWECDVVKHYGQYNTLKISALS